MNKLNIGDYVRTKDGIIGKIKSKNFIGYNDFIIDTLYYNDDETIDDWTCGVKGYNIIKTSPRIIDLIEKNDLITLTSEYCKDEVYRVIGKLKGLIELDLFEDGTMQITKDEDIKSVVTHEQFENISYKVGE